MSFQYHMPVRVIAGADCVWENGALFAPFGARALIVTGRSSAKNGALDDVAAVLRRNGQAFAVYDRVEANPSVATVRECAALARSFGADFIVAAGGGSPMDAAKAVALCARQEVGDIFTHPIGGDVLPMIHIPTTAGTGSEVTQYSVLTDDAAQTKRSIAAPQLFPRLAFLDGKYMATLPQSVTVNTALDALSHAVEGMLSVRAGAFSDALARESLRLLGGEFPALCAGEDAAEDHLAVFIGRHRQHQDELIGAVGRDDVALAEAVQHDLPEGGHDLLQKPGVRDVALEIADRQQGDVHRLPCPRDGAGLEAVHLLKHLVVAAEGVLRRGFLAEVSFDRIHIRLDRLHPAGHLLVKGPDRVRKGDAQLFVEEIGEVLVVRNGLPPLPRGDQGPHHRVVDRLVIGVKDDCHLADSDHILVPAAAFEHPDNLIHRIAVKGSIIGGFVDDPVGIGGFGQKLSLIQLDRL